jgi:hypothetical protein
MRITEVTERMFSAILTHETTPQAAAQIRQQGFQKPRFGQGIFFNADNLSYTGGSYGGAEVQAQISGPESGILNLEGDHPEDLDEFADGDEIAEYARDHDYWAWTDGMQFVVLDSKHIKVLS